MCHQATGPWGLDAHAPRVCTLCMIHRARALLGLLHGCCGGQKRVPATAAAHYDYTHFAGGSLWHLITNIRKHGTCWEKWGVVGREYGNCELKLRLWNFLWIEFVHVILPFAQRYGGEKDFLNLIFLLVRVTTVQENSRARQTRNRFLCSVAPLLPVAGTREFSSGLCTLRNDVPDQLTTFMWTWG